MNSVSPPSPQASLPPVAPELREGHHPVKLDTHVRSFIFNPWLSLLIPTSQHHFPQALPLRCAFLYVRFPPSTASMALPQFRTPSCLTLSFVITSQVVFQSLFSPLQSILSPVTRYSQSPNTRKSVHHGALDHICRGSHKSRSTVLFTLTHSGMTYLLTICLQMSESMKVVTKYGILL